MYKVNVMYPNQEGVKFDFDYYRKNHMDLVKKHLKPFGLIKTAVEKGISGGGDLAAPYICIGKLYFKTQDGFDRGLAKVGKILGDDIPNFTNVKPVRQISEIFE